MNARAVAVLKQPKLGSIGDIVGHWRLRSYDRNGEWFAACRECEHVQSIRIHDVYLPKCRSCGCASSYLTPSVRPKYIRSKS